MDLRRARLPAAIGPGELKTRIEQFSFFSGLLIVNGHVLDVGRDISGIAVHVGTCIFQTKYDRATGEFAFRGETPFDEHSFRGPRLCVSFAGGEQHFVDDFVNQELSRESGHQLFDRFLQRLRNTPPGSVLEIGARARSGVTRRAFIPEGWDYVGFDIVQGENVDVTGDAHSMSQQLAPGRFGAVMSFSVFEHLAMPWKVVLEMNKIMAVGGLAYIQTHQSWPLHEIPWDFWRFSSAAWPALFNEATGFRIIEVGSAEPVMMVARRWHPVANFGKAEGSALSAVLVEKVSETALSWDVDLSRVAIGNYPH